MYIENSNNISDNKFRLSNKNKINVVIVVIVLLIIAGGISFYKNITNSRKLSLISAKNYIVTLNSMTYYYNSTAMEKKIADGTYEVGEIEVNTNNNPKAGYVILENGKVKSASLKFQKIVNYDNENYAVVSKLRETPDKNIKSKEIDEFCKIENALSSRTISKGDKYSCDPGDGKSRYFYVIEVTDTNVTMIMDRNLGGNVSWCNLSGANPYSKVCNGDGALTILAQRTANWKNVNVGLPSLKQILSINNGMYSFNNYPFVYNSGNNKTYCNTTDANCVELFGGEANENTYGYWLKDASWLGVDTAFQVEFDNRTIFYTGVGTPNRLGIRPIITVNRK